MAKTWAGETSPYQQDVLRQLRVRSLGCMGTSPDGNCLFNGVSQGLAGGTAEQVLQQPKQGQQRHAELRQQAANELRTNKWCLKQIQLDSVFVMNRDFALKSKHAAQPDVPTALLLASHVEQDKAWAGGYTITALALALHKHIFVVNTHGSALYAKSMDCWQAPKDHGYYPHGCNSRRSRRIDFPAVVLEDSTVFLIYNGRDHYWAAVRQGVVPRRAELEKAGLGIDSMI